MPTCTSGSRLPALFPILAIVLALATGTAVAQEFWVDAKAGDDANPGTELLPFATITHAITAGGVAATIQVLPGTYDAAQGEVFPIILLTDQSLFGDPETKGAGSEATMIVGKGDYAGVTGNGRIATVVCGPGSEIAGFQIDADSYIARHAAVVISGSPAEVHDNQFLHASSAGVFMTSAHASQVQNNVFETSDWGVLLEDSPSAPVIAGNLFVSPMVAVMVNGVVSNPWVHDNVFQAGSEACVLVTRGAPRIEGNTFEAGSGTVWGGVSTGWPSAAPVVRRNTFFNSLGVRIEAGTPDLGTESDRGQNDFRGIDGVCIQHNGSAGVWATGNSWPHEPPIMGVDIIVDGDGMVILGTVPLEHTSIGKLKTAF